MNRKIIGVSLLAAFLIMFSGTPAHAFTWWWKKGNDAQKQLKAQVSDTVIATSTEASTSTSGTSTAANSAGINTVAPTATTTATSSRPGGRMGAGTSTQTGKPTLDTACMQTAVEKRDGAVISLLNGYYTTTTAALTARKDTLKQAWGITDQKQRRTEIQKVWNLFQGNARKAALWFRGEKKRVWTQFYTERKACGTTGASDDPGTEGMDVSL